LGEGFWYERGLESGVVELEEGNECVGEGVGLLKVGGGRRGMWERVFVYGMVNGEGGENNLIGRLI
jgi:hypothetical protein